MAVSSTKVKIGVVGVGHLGFHHVRVLSQLADAELVGIFDIDRKRAEEVASVWNTVPYKDLDSLLNDVDAISCVVTTENHYQVGRRVLEAGKHLFLEKPMARTLQEAEDLIKLAKSKGVKFQIGHIERFNPAVLAIMDIVNSPQFIESHRLSPYSARSLDTDVVLDLMIHDIDLTILYMGKEPVKIEGAGVQVLSDKVDVANARLEFDKGEIANLTASRVYIGKKRKIRIFQKDAYISIDFVTREVEVFRKISDAILPFFPHVDKELEPLKLELKSFVDAIKFDRRPPVTGEDGYKALKVAIKVVEEIEKRLELAGFSYESL
ncbi:MAG: gfo/Idh/MocA family oxidoreductase [Candidatus Hydrothermota bacterium]|nr:MAG: gfo/Idh/MocA family oxidoreductase [Candidatus Hydrothermae bacterium]